jgi:sensor histidine kinase regulating citrate/malate metabolism
MAALFNFKFKQLSYKIGILIIVTEFVALLAWAFFYSNSFTSQINDGLKQNFKHLLTLCRKAYYGTKLSKTN